mmetsp:Transcript_17420/g.26227  ORF Transcript_17420/g.26227 Transcript_17420/m.26227 type:complete len:94 (-) Transcript_17420:11-292(-)
MHRQKKDGRKSGLAREPRMGDLGNEQKYLQWRHNDLNQQWSTLLHAAAEETRIKGTWASIEFRRCFGITRYVFDILLVESRKSPSLPDNMCME